jgi:hypothetical protein
MLESPELLRTIFDFCDMRTLVKISSVKSIFRGHVRSDDIQDGGSYGPL